VGAQARFVTPSVLAYHDGELYVADINAQSIRKVSIDDGRGIAVAGGMYDTGACDGSGADDGVSTQARFFYPERLAALDGEL
jgi:hypothetical protein